MRHSPRLLAIMDMAAGTEVLADVGCDHAILDILMCRKYPLMRAIAMDVRQGPLERAQDNIRLSRLQDRIETRLSDGLDALNLGEADTIVITGMGGHLIIDILKRGFTKAREAKKLILSPQHDLEFVNDTLAGWGFNIDEVRTLADKGHMYTIELTHYDNDTR